MNPEEIAKWLHEILTEIRAIRAQQGKPVQEWFTPNELAAMMQPPRAAFTIREHCRAGRIRCEKAGNRRGDRYRIPKAEVDRILSGGAYLEPGDDR